MKNNLCAKKILALLKKTYGRAHCTLHFRNPLELLVATILSAQCTDERVNRVTPALFKKYPSAQAYADANIHELERLVHSTGFYKNKAKHIKGCGAMMMNQFDGRVPSRMEDLIRLPGVARKTANVVLSVAFKKNEGVAVDTHVKRTVSRLKLSREKDPEKIEQDLMKIVPQRSWDQFSLLLIQHGREICIALRPKCSMCVLQKICPSAFTF